MGVMMLGWLYQGRIFSHNGTGIVAKGADQIQAPETPDCL